MKNAHKSTEPIFPKSSPSHHEFRLIRPADQVFLPLGDPELRKRLKAGASCFELVLCWPGGDDFQRFGQTGPATFVQFVVGSLSDAYRRHSQSADAGKDGAHHWARDSHLGELEGAAAGVTEALRQPRRTKTPDNRLAWCASCPHGQNFRADLSVTSREVV